MQYPIEENQSDLVKTTTPRATFGRFLLEMLQTIVMAMILYLIIDSVVARVRVENISMKPTLQAGEFVLVNKLAYHLGQFQCGDIIVFHYPANPQEDYIKRVIGLPGDNVKIHHGLVFVNGNQLDEPYIESPPLYNGDWVITADTVFVLGDNRNQSSDSHSWGFVPVQNVVGKALAIYWPLDQLRILTVPPIAQAASIK